MDSDKRLQRGAFASLGSPVWSYGITPNGGGGDKGLRIMNHQRLKRAVGTFDDGFVASDKVKHVDAAARVVRRRFREPVPPRLDEFALVQTGAFFTPAFAAAERLETVDEISFHP